MVILCQVTLMWGTFVETVISIRNPDDLAEIWSDITERRNKIVLWCDGLKMKDSSGGATSSRRRQATASESDEEEEIQVVSEEKKEEKFSSRGSRGKGANYHGTTEREA